MSYFTVFVSACLNISVIMWALTHCKSSTPLPVSVCARWFSLMVHLLYNLQNKYLVYSVTIIAKWRHWFHVSYHLGQAFVENIGLPGWGMRHCDVCFSSSFFLNPHFLLCSAFWHSMDEEKRKGKKSEKPQINFKFSKISESWVKEHWQKLWILTPLLKRGSPPKGHFLHRPLNSPLLHRSENYKIINHSLTPQEAK